MKTRKLTLCAFAAIAALATACSNDEPASTDTPREGIVIEAIASTPQGGADTRLTHKDEGDMDILWAAGDSFTAYSAENKASYTTKDANSTSASFTGNWGAAPSGDVYAIYPSNQAGTPTAITLSLKGQTGLLDGLKSYDYMTATATYKIGESLNFGFTHQVAIVKLVLTFPDGVTGDASNIGLLATGLSQSAKLNLTTGIFSSKVAGVVTTGANALTIGSDGKLTAYLCVFAGALTDVRAIAKVGNDNYKVDLSDLEIVEGKMYTATVMMEKEAAIEWATGNLVAKADGSGCEIGAPTDSGLFFQFGSLVGWSADPLAITVKPTAFNGDASYTATEKIWQGTTGTVPFTVKDSGSDDEKAGIGDPCRYYLGGTWRLPTKYEYMTLFNNTVSTNYTDTGGWSWDKATETAIHSTKDFTFPTSGFLQRTTGALGGNMLGYYWSASPGTGASGSYLLVYSGYVRPNDNNARAAGLRVRCVQNASN